MCWPFADIWLETPPSSPPPPPPKRPHRRRETRKIFVPSEPAKHFATTNSRSRNEHKVIAAKRSAHTSFNINMTATAEDDSGSEPDHWPDDATGLEHVAIAAPGYNSHNALRSQSYVAAKSPSVAPSKAPSKAASSPKFEPVQQQAVYYQGPAFSAYHQPQYTYAPQPRPQPYAYPYPQAYYGYPTAPVYPPQQMANYHVYQPQYAAPQQPRPYEWKGRTKKQVEEDNMILAAKVGAYDKRKVVPTGVKDEQMMWCVETDGSHTLRTFVSIKGLKGEWKKDPRFEESYYFVRGEGEKKEETRGEKKGGKM
ncbi:hypothetical protein LTR78_000058 [Recurvomyces mirabilis]|uniref:Uncharacterized protein n=1 Tax=Recurvomyces mirabilis TaxID=574656 RepID=A0AAE1C669_9PEZI|nr:hypothetical protein LTR78_000058 [Recurvomyces mirabilis]KAK5161714.1 hypothetical protein LTS14_000059 [Recurvomyces mirabilis]